MSGHAHDLAADARLAGELVRAAGQFALRMRAEGAAAGGLGSEQKTSVSDIVTAADHAAERMIVERLARERPGDGILAEEGSRATGTSGRTWVIDPVDGTYNFHSGLPWWCSALALVDADDVLLGAVHHPHDDTLFLGGPDLPSTRDGAPLGRVPDLPLAEVCATTYLHYPRATPDIATAFARVAGHAATVRMLGSGSMDAMAIAQGQLGVSFQHTVADWDRLPGAAIIRGAGGEASRIEAAGVVWSVAGSPTAVAEVRDLLADR
ncbi:inositol monophosphatase [Nocardioides sp. KIGAM211]|uniref:Inositol monophosphatase n=1 Tax=Nocardioides luti TaxID=2761101 RepID=A0A7X0VCZ3_9ACTN|nr:inositol monophosphatase [Nocardioides luti]MBB6629532.1 inositol monophosphatase [Nocardioides luti]